MVDFLRPLKRKKGEITLVLDIGTEAVKALLIQQSPAKINILGSSLEYFDSYGVFDGRDFERDVLERVILKTLQNLGLENEKAKKDLSVILGLPANIFKGKVVFQNFKRERPQKRINEKEEKLICQRLLEEAKKKISQIYSENSGILRQDIQFINLKILEIKIDGYRVPALLGYEGRDLNFRILATFSAGDYLKEIENICQAMGFRDKKIIHEIEGLIFYFKETPEGIFLDLGGEISQIFLVKNGRLEEVDELRSSLPFADARVVDELRSSLPFADARVIDEFEIGGKIFSQALSEKLGLRLSEARILKERYSKKELSKESSERIKEIFWLACQTWFENLKSKLKEMSPARLLPQNIILFGGGSQLPEIKEILKESNWENLSFNIKPNIKILQPRDLKIVIEEIKNLDNPQYTPSLLLWYASRERASD